MAQLLHLDPDLAINPSQAQAERFLSLDPEAPTVIINLHEYHPRAQYPADYADPTLPPDVTGREAYHRYLRGVESRLMPQTEGRLLMVAPCDLVMVGAGPWEEVVIGYYPKRAITMQLAALPGYQELVVHRTAGLKSVLAVALGAEALARLGPSMLSSKKS
jgi:hypothetical protein